MNRWMVQAIATFLSNANLPGFVKGEIYSGRIKSICVPGLNCYSCPGAMGACPIGSLQSIIGSPRYNFSYYIVGILILFGALLGRAVCGFLCPFGWFQELLHKIPSKKCSTQRAKYLRWIKYFILVVFVIVLPLTVVNKVGMGSPFFCKWICPVGILEGAIPLSIVNEGIRGSLGSLFTWKACVLLGVLTLAVFFYRPFCKWVCPLGAFYSLFNNVAVYRYRIDKDKCNQCGACSKVCLMDVDVSTAPNHAECIRCGDCVNICPNDAISLNIKFKKDGERTWKLVN